MSLQLRRYIPLAPFPGAALLAASYGIDPSYETTWYTLHSWSTIGVVAGWTLLLAGLSILAPSLTTRWIAVIGSASFIAGPSNPGAAEIALFGLGFLLTAVQILVAAASAVVVNTEWKGRVAWSIVLSAVGVTAASRLGYPGNPFFDSPARQVLGCLMAAPLVIGIGSLWARLDRASQLDSRTESGIVPLDESATFLRRFAAGMLTWVSWAALSTGLAAINGAVETLVSDSAAQKIMTGFLGYPWSFIAGVLLLQTLPTALWGQTFGQRILGVRVVRIDNGSQPGWLRAIVRSVLFQTVPLVGFIYLMALGMKARFGVGGGVPNRLVWDHGSGTAVVNARWAPASKTSSPESPTETSVRPDATWEAYE